jgi:hypothetical protein
MMNGFGIDPADAFKLLVALVSVVGAVGVYGFMRAETRRADAAVLAAGLFIFMPYRFTDLWTRGDLAELTAISLLPYPLWFFRALVRVPHAQLARTAAAAAVTLALMLLTHTILSMLTTELLALLLVPPLVARWRDGERGRAVLAAAALVSAIGLSLIYTMPALLEKKYVHIYWMIGDKAAIATNGIWSRFLLGSETYFYYPGEPVLLGLAAAPILLALPSTRRRLRKAWPWWLLAAASLVVMLKPVAPLWQYLPFGRFVQFPWRVLALLCVVGPVAIATSWAALVPVGWSRRLTAVGVMVALFGLASARYDVMIEHRITRNELRDISTDLHATTVNDEYLPIGVEAAPKLGRDKHPVSVTSGPITVDATQNHGLGFRMQLTARGPGQLQVQTFWFPGWEARTISGTAPVTLASSSDGLMAIYVPAAGTYDVALELHRTQVQTIASVATLFSWLCFYPALLLLARRYGSSLRS